jgi:hypothetical protein
MPKHFAPSMSLLLILLAVALNSCGRTTPASAQTLLGRWHVTNEQNLSVPNSFFWFSMDYVEFRADGTVASLIQSPPNETELRLNKTARYALTNTRHLAVTGACRHQDPCIGLYTTALAGDELTIFDSGGQLVLVRVGDASEELAPTAVGPAPSPTPPNAALNGER